MEMDHPHARDDCKSGAVRLDCEVIGLSMMSYRLLVRKEDRFGGVPVERSHGEIVILPSSDRQLLLKISKGIKGVTGIEFLIVLSMATLNLTVVPWGVRLNQLVQDAQLFQSSFEEGFLFGGLGVQAVGKL